MIVRARIPLAIAWLTLLCAARAGAADSSVPAVAIGTVAAVTKATPPAQQGTPRAMKPVPVIWSGLVLATNDAKPKPVPKQLTEFADQLTSVFGYNQFEIISENSQWMDGPYEHLLTPSRDFYLSVRIHSRPNKSFPLKISLYQNRKSIADFDALLAFDSPLFIRGPLYAGGQLIIIMQVSQPATR